MLEQEYERLVHYLEGMILDGVLLVHGGNLLNWSDTIILDILKEIKKKKAEAQNMTCEIGDLLKNRQTGQKCAVMLIDENTIQLLPSERIIIIPKDKIGYCYQKSNPGE